jgi:hypothetical protein
MARKGISYKELARRLETIGVQEKEKQLMNKVARGKFAFTFFLQCMYAMGVDSLWLPEIEEPEAK